MHIWSCLKNFLYDKDNFIALYDNYIYIYNFTKVLSISNKEIKSLTFKNIDMDDAEGVEEYTIDW